MSGLRVGSFESRKQAEIKKLIENLGGVATVAPSMREVPLEENKDAVRFGEELLAGRISALILFTGVGTRTLLEALFLKNPKEKILAALKKIPIVARGPKPVAALAEVNLKPTVTVPEPNTWREMLKTIDQKLPIEGKTVAVQEYGEPNKLFLAELKARGAHVLQVPVYRAEFPKDTAPLKNLIHSVIDKNIDVLLFTNATQIEHALMMARQEGVAQEFKKAAQNIVVASVGPSCTEALQKFGFPVDLEPERPMMGALVARAAQQAPALLQEKKKRADIVISPIASKNGGDELNKSLFLKACRREKTERTPIWLMRQAGRYLKEYRELRAKVEFLELCKNSDLASEVTVDAAHRLGVDAAIIFSDILIIVEPLGFKLSYQKDEGPEISNPFREKNDLKRLKPVEPDESLGFVYEAIRKTRRALKKDIPLIGFCGAPFTVASYVIEGKGSKTFSLTKALMYKTPEIWHNLLEKITDASIAYLNGQIAAGAQAVQIFDSWVGCLSPEDFRAYVLPHTKRLIKNIVPGVPVISFGTQNSGFLPLLKQAGGDVIGVDWRIELDEAWDMLGDVAIQGNLDPQILLSDEKIIRAQATRILNQAAGRPGHIFNLGHGVLPATPLENVQVLIDCVKQHRAH